MIGAPAVSLIGGYYVADLTGSGTVVATIVGLAMFATVVVANLFGLRISSGFQLALSSVLVVVMATAISVALPSRAGDNWTPFAPHGWWAVGTAANILVWLFVGWEAVAQLAGDFRRPEIELPRAMALAFGVVTVIYIGLAVATIGVTGGTDSKVPLADLIAVGFGRAGRDATAVLAVDADDGDDERLPRRRREADGGAGRPPRPAAVARGRRAPQRAAPPARAVHGDDGRRCSVSSSPASATPTT